MPTNQFKLVHTSEFFTVWKRESSDGVTFYGTERVNRTVPNKPPIFCSLLHSLEEVIAIGNKKHKSIRESPPLTFDVVLAGMQQGKKYRRDAWGETVNHISIGFVDGIDYAGLTFVANSQVYDAILSGFDILADDWVEVE
ncbi:MAG: hypothetical protein ACYCOU_07430 [Sulfobacillus sp.]